MLLLQGNTVLLVGLEKRRGEKKILLSILQQNIQKANVFVNRPIEI